MPQVKVKISNAEPNTGKKLIAILTNAPLRRFGYPEIVQWQEYIKEVDESTDAVPPNSNERTASLYKQGEEKTFNVNERKISSTTRLYLPEDTVDVNAITLKDYFATKVINQFPGVAGGDQAWKFAEGILKEVIAIKQANGEMPV